MPREEGRDGRHYERLPSDAPEVVRLVWRTVASSKVVQGISLVGSRAKGYSTELSDWDLYLEGALDELMAEIPGLMAPLGPLAAFWDPLSERAGYMMVMVGPVKIDLFPADGRRALQAPWDPSRDSLAAIDGHVWDWVLWLGGKALRHQAELVTDELAKMHWFLLGPLGVERTPGDLREAVAWYRDARAEASRRFASPVDEELGRQVLGALRQYRLVD